MRKRERNKNSELDKNKIKSPKIKKEKIKKQRIKKEKPPKKEKRPKRVNAPKKERLSFLKRKKQENLPTGTPVSSSKQKMQGVLEKIITYMKQFASLIVKAAKQIPKLKIFLPQRLEKDAPLLDSTVKVQPLFCIQTKLIGCFIIPVIMIVILGITSFSKASGALTQNYEGAVSQSISMTKEYFDFV